MSTRTISLSVCLFLLIIPAIYVYKYVASSHKKPTGPRVTVIMVIDQWAYHYLPKLSKNFKYGIRKLLDNGIVFTQAHHPHGVPETTPGHHAISTGTVPKYHGATYNSWIIAEEDYKKLNYECDDSHDAAVIKCHLDTPHAHPVETYMPGRSSKHTMVDGLSDQFVNMQAANPKANYIAYALSLKMHPVISCANRQGLPIWFDQKFGNFTSSKKFFSRLPSWLINFNKKHRFSDMTKTKWKLMYNLNHPAYDFPDARNYDFAGYPESMATASEILCGKACKNDKEAPFERFLKTPQSSQALFDLARCCIDSEIKNDNDRLLLFISVSNVDLCGHIYGPDSLENIDLNYHVDRQIGEFMDFVTNKFGEKECLFLLTADHGICPFPELMHARGNNLARRIMAEDVIKDMNQIMQEKFGLSDFVKAYEPTFFVCNQEILSNMDSEQKATIFAELKQFLLKQPGIKKVWTYDELAQLPFDASELEQFYKNQMYKGRSGDLIVMTQPYCLLTKYPKGTSHSSPYEYDTHVPLMLYQAGRFDKKTLKNNTIPEKVWTPQIPVTIAQILGIMRPTASPYKVLPGLGL